MRRTVRTTVTGALLLSLAACSGSTGDVAAPTPAATGPASASATPSPVSSPTATAGYAANTKQVCGKVDKLLDGKQMERFAGDLGVMITYKKAGQTAKAKASRESAKKNLTALAVTMRKTTGAAKDPRVVTAGQKSAVEIAKTVADDTFFSKITSIKSLDSALTGEMTPWLTPLAFFCA